MGMIADSGLRYPKHRSGNKKHHFGFRNDSSLLISFLAHWPFLNKKSFSMKDQVCKPVCFWCNPTGCNAVTPGRDLGHFSCIQSHGPCQGSLPTQSICTMLSWNLRVKHILPVVLQAFHPMRQSPACSITLSGLEQQWQSSSCITVHLSSSCTCWPSSMTRYWSGKIFALPRRFIFKFF